MKKYDLFDILGPIMIGPSSSHTAGAARIGKMARTIYGAPFKGVRFYLHGSFKETYRGHGSDRALIGGVLGMNPDDENLVQSPELAESNGVSIEFIPADLGYVHPNTVKVAFLGDSDEEKFYVIGSSVGGGKIEIIDIDGVKVRFTGEYPTIIGEYADRFGMIRDISTILTETGLNIAGLKVTREDGMAQLVMEIDQDFPDTTIDAIRQLPNMRYAIGIKTI
ncbi:MAG: L-serine ammonia-lyase, iron-sulfur-dependent subunit beta [Tissierellia bacterium]|nr:L-serine ammonia-lyase, iron-sulfur-dependent subunit beta [Tissierellia bacterium]